MFRRFNKTIYFENRRFNEGVYEFDIDDEFNDIPEDHIDLAGYKWSLIGRLNGGYLYLCDDIVKQTAFKKDGGSNDWRESDIRAWLNGAFYRKLSSNERELIKPYRGDDIFLLSINEYEKFRSNIKNINDYWWLRSPGYEINRAANVHYNGNVDDYGSLVYNTYKWVGVRPAVLLK